MQPKKSLIDPKQTVRWLRKSQTIRIISQAAIMMSLFVSQRLILLAIMELAVVGCAQKGTTKVEIEDAPQPTPAQRAEIEARVRGCGLPVRNGRWLPPESIEEQWSFNFETDPSLMGQPNAKTECVSAAADAAMRAWFRPPIIAFSGT